MRSERLRCRSSVNPHTWRSAQTILARPKAFRYAVPMRDASRPVGDLTDEQVRKRLRMPVQEAAHLLGISPEAVRSRLYRGTLDKETGTDGTVYVRLHDDQLTHDDEQTADQTQPNTELVGELRARVEGPARAACRGARGTPTSGHDHRAARTGE